METVRFFHEQTLGSEKTLKVEALSLVQAATKLFETSFQTPLTKNQTAPEK